MYSSSLFCFFLNFFVVSGEYSFLTSYIVFILCDIQMNFIFVFLIFRFYYYWHFQNYLFPACLSYIETSIYYLSKLSIGYIVAKFGSICNVCFYRLWLRLLRLWGLSRWLQWSLLRWLLSIRRLLFRLCAASAACQREGQAASTGGSPFLMVLKSRFRSWIIITFFSIPAVVWLWHSVRGYIPKYVLHLQVTFNPDHPAHIFCLSV